MWGWESTKKTRKILEKNPKNSLMGSILKIRISSVKLILNSIFWSALIIYTTCYYHYQFSAVSRSDSCCKELSIFFSEESEWALSWTTARRLKQKSRSLTERVLTSIPVQQVVHSFSNKLDPCLYLLIISGIFIINHQSTRCQKPSNKLQSGCLQKTPQFWMLISLSAITDSLPFTSSN